MIEHPRAAVLRLERVEALQPVQEVGQPSSRRLELVFDGRCRGRHGGNIFSGFFEWRRLTQPQFGPAEHHDTGGNECSKDRKRHHTGAS